MPQLQLDDGRTLDVHDDGGDGPALLWHHGTPHTGAPLDRVLDAARAHGWRHVTYARPGYGATPAQPGRAVADAVRDADAIAQALQLDRFAVAGASGGGPHALACAALLGPDRVTGVVVAASPAPYAEGFDWFAGMHAPGALRAARAGRAARAAFAEEFDPDTFTAADWAAIQGDWRGLAEDAMAAATAPTHDGEVDDDVAFAAPWGFALADVRSPVLILQGGQDRMIPASHAHALLAALPGDVAELWLRPRHGHVSVLGAALGPALRWLRAPAP